MLKNIENIPFYLEIKISYFNNRSLLLFQKKNIYDKFIYYKIDNFASIAIFKAFQTQSYTQYVISNDRLLATQPNVSTQSYTKPVIFHNKLITHN